MPAFLAALAALVRAITIGMFVKTLLSIGFGISTFVGVLAFVEYAQEQIWMLWGQLPSDLVQLLVIAHADTGLSIVLSAIVFRWTYGFGPKITFNKPGAQS